MYRHSLPYHCCLVTHSALQGQLICGKVNLTCDAWQASNADAYFAVTGHWVEESSPSVWAIKSALLGFTWMNTAHNGRRLGQALFKIIERLEITHKVCSTHPSSPMRCSLIAFSDRSCNLRQCLKQWHDDGRVCLHVSRQTNRPYDVSKNHIRFVPQLLLVCSCHLMMCSCLAHIVNLATQALLSTYIYICFCQWTIGNPM